MPDLIGGSGENHAMRISWIIRADALC
jgi:hypothetical protein